MLYLVLRGGKNKVIGLMQILQMFIFRKFVYKRLSQHFKYMSNILE